MKLNIGNLNLFGNQIIVNFCKHRCDYKEQKKGDKTVKKVFNKT